MKGLSPIIGGSPELSRFSMGYFKGSAKFKFEVRSKKLEMGNAKIEIPVGDAAKDAMTSSIHSSGLDP